MSNDQWYLERYSDRKPSLYLWVGQQMVTGAVYAFFAVMAVLAVIFLFVALGALLPDAAREAPDPSPWPVSQSAGAASE
ncbi:MAG: RC-LH1 core complex protein PufX [Pseudomonadota bacterium]